MSIAPFRDSTELLGFARAFVSARTNSLLNDVQHCLTTRRVCTACGREHELPTYAPFPALLYCFSTIDLLAALYAGNATAGATVSNSKTYMCRVMGYTDEQARLLQRLFRHKLVHLAEPKAVVEDAGRRISWHYKHDSDARHLQICSLPAGSEVVITTGWRERADYEFRLSISMFAEQIGASAVTPPDGYLPRLEREQDLQERFVHAIEQVYDPRL